MVGGKEYALWVVSSTDTGRGSLCGYSSGRWFELSATTTSAESIPNIATRVRTSGSFAVVTALIRLRGRHSLPVWAMTGLRLACWYSSFCAIRSTSLINSGTG